MRGALSVMFLTSCRLVSGFSWYCTPIQYWLLLLRVDPEVAVHGDAGVQGGGHGLEHLVDVQAELVGLLAVDLDEHLRVVEPLQDADVGRRRHGLTRSRISRALALASCSDAAGHLDLDRRGRAVVRAPPTPCRRCRS